jgi:hypothetical protein
MSTWQICLIASFRGQISSVMPEQVIKSTELSKYVMSSSQSCHFLSHAVRRFIDGNCKIPVA